MRRVNGRVHANRGFQTNILLLMAAGPVAALLLPRSSPAASLTWDSSAITPTAPVDGAGAWNLTTANWSNGTNDNLWPNDTTIAVFGNGGSAGTVNLAVPITAGALTFNTTTGDYAIAGNGNSLTLAGVPIITVASGQSPTINAPLAGTAGFSLNGPGTLNLVADNTALSGTIAINSGTLVVGSASNLGSTSNLVSLGTTNSGTSINDPVGSLTLSTGLSTTIGSFLSATNNALGNTVTINSGSTLNIVSSSPLIGVNQTTNAAFIVGAPNILAPITTKLTLSGGGSLNVNGGTNNSSFLVGLGNTNTSADQMNYVVDMTGLTNFTFTTGIGSVPATGGNEFAVGHGGGAAGTLSLATNNSVTAGAITVADNSITPGLTGVIPAPNAPGNPSTLNLGGGTNTLNANTFNIGGGRAQGIVTWAATTTTGTLTIAGATGGASSANITVGNLNFGTPPSSASSLTFKGHSVTVQAGTVILGELSGSTGGKASTTAGGTITFDTGTFSAVNLEMAVNSSGTSSDTLTGTFNLGSSSTSTGILNVTNSFLIADNTNSANAAAATSGVFTIKGGVANIGANMIDVSITGTSATTLAVSGGTLNMEGFAIGPKLAAGNTSTVGSRSITTITFPTLGNSAVLENLGGTGINDAGLTMTATGTLILDGVNNYSGATTVTATGGTATLQIGQAGDVTPPVSALRPAVTVNTGAVLAFGSSQSMTNSSTISGAGSVAQTGTGTTTLAGANNYSGVTSFVAGTLAVNSLPNEGAGGVISPLGIASNAASSLVLTGGTFQYLGAATSSDRLFTITPTGGGIDASGGGAIIFNNGGNMVSADAPSRAATDSITSPKITLANVSDLVAGMTVTGTNIPAGTTIISINPSANSITLSATPTAAGADTLSFGAASRTLTLTGSNTGNNTMSNRLTNSAGGAPLGLTKSGVGTWILTAPNNYTGNTRVSAGTLVLSDNGTIASGNLSLDAPGVATISGILTASPTLTVNGALTFAPADGINAPTNAFLNRTTSALTVAAGGSVTLGATTAANHAGRTVLVAASFSNAGRIDVNNNDMIIRNGDTGPVTTPGSIANQLQTGFNATSLTPGYWNGPSGIISTSAATDTRFLTTIGNMTGGGVFDGVSTSNSDMLLKYTYYGDADLSGTVDGADYQQIDNGFGLGLTGWSNGDFNYDGVVNGSDFALIDNTFNQITAIGATPLAVIASPAIVIPVPEPTSLSLIALAAMALQPRRRRSC